MKKRLAIFLLIILILATTTACGKSKENVEKEVPETALEKHFDSQLEKIEKAEKAVEQVNENTRKIEELSKELDGE